MVSNHNLALIGGISMLEILEIDAIRLTNNVILVRWDVASDSDHESLEDYSYAVYKSFAPNGEYELLVDRLTTNEFSYQVTEEFSSTTTLYFKVGITDLETGVTIMSALFAPVVFVPNDPIAEVIIVVHNYFLEYVLNRPPVTLLIKKRSGIRCPDCWDEDLQQVTRSHCTSCYSTGYLNGYMSCPVYISFREPGFTEKFDVSNVYDDQHPVTEGWAPDHPIIRPGDIIVDEFNRRFRVLQSQPTAKDGRMYLRQVLQLQLIPSTDIIYKFPSYSGVIIRDYYSKDIVFRIKGFIKEGVQYPHISFPFTGRIEGIHIFCVEPGVEDTAVLVQKTSQSNFEDQADNWESITSTEIIIPAGERVASYTELSDFLVNKGDYFRVYVTNAGSGIEHMTVQLSVKIPTASMT